MNLLVLGRQVERFWCGWYNFDEVLRSLLFWYNWLLFNFNLILIVDRVDVDRIRLVRFILFIRNNWTKCTWYLVGRKKWGIHNF